MSLALLLAGTAAAQPAALVALERVDSEALWPGFDLGSVPIAAYDGEDTWLLGHPSPPEEFAPESDGLARFAGRHDAVVANTSIELGGAVTATVHLTGSGDIPLIVHEAFHVHTDRTHPDWRANEAELFTWPVDDAELLAVRRLESEALFRARTALSDRRMRAWARLAVELRLERFRRMAPTAVAYERAVERYEGLAEYVEGRARGAPKPFPTLGFPADAVRLRAYSSGETLALLLDKVDADWRDQLDTRGLDELLDAATVDVRHARLPKGAAERAVAGAATDAAAVHSERLRARADHLAADGWQLVVLADVQAPLWPEGFDPLHIVAVPDSTDVLHTRWVAVGNEHGRLEVLDRSALTEGLGPHPLFQGVHRAVVTGLSEPALVDGALQLDAPGLKLRVERGDVRLDADERVATVALGPAVRAVADPRVFALYAWANASGYDFENGEAHGALRQAVRDTLEDRACPQQAAFAASRRRDHPWLSGHLALSSVLDGPPGFALARDADAFALEHQRGLPERLPGVSEALRDYWACAELDALWTEHRPALDAEASRYLAATPPVLKRVRRAMHAESWPDVRIVPNPLDARGRGFSSTWGDEVSVFVGPSEEPNVGLVVHEVLHHVVDPIARAEPCHGAEADHAAAPDELRAAYPDAEVWVAETVVRALTSVLDTVPHGGDPDAAVARWVEEGLTWMPEVVAHFRAARGGLADATRALVAERCSAPQ